MLPHDPVRQVSFIQQTLSQNQRPIAFLIGAGCPLSIRIVSGEGDHQTNRPLIQDVAGLTKLVHENLKSKDGNPTDWDRLLKTAADDGSDCDNIEHLLSRVRNFYNVAGVGEVRGLTATQLLEIDRRICSTISEEVNKALPTNDTPYHDLAIWSRSVTRHRPVQLFTTNYDLLIEQAMEESGSPYFDGFVGSREAFFDLGAVEDEQSLPGRWTRLWKIHGSLNWRLQENRTVVRTNQLTPDQPYLIYPSHLKYDQSRKMPYLAMLDRLKSFLMTSSSVLVTCGYSFADEHINEVICSSASSNPTAHVFGLLFGSIDQPGYALAQNCAKTTPNLSLLAKDKAIIGRNLATWRQVDADEAFLTSDSLTAGEEGTSFNLGDFSNLGRLLRSLALRESSDGQ